ncbi:RTA1 [Candida margitis]|uniref:RTA1 n=1 Tax=Candida margitis TaxID=1775924 RepID=UPI002226CA9C|nr:RTA1 [Candida margitis]KAI5961120.1 RTA1 [Candida margitis]
MSEESSDYQFYQYIPNFGVAVHYVVLFLILAIVEAYFIVSKYIQFRGRIKSKNLKRYCNVMIPFLVGILLEVIGYAARSASCKDPENLMPYAIQSVFILIGPTLILASTYMIFCELAKSLSAEFYSIVPLSYLAKIFVTGDIISLFVQASGGGLQVIQSDTLQVVGRASLITGVIVQFLFFAGFCYVFFRFAMRIRKNPTKRASTLESSFPKMGNWKHALMVLGSSCILLMVRSVFRCVEMIEGTNGHVQSREVYLFVLDTVMVQVTIYLHLTFNWTGYFCRVHDFYSSVFDVVELESIIN